MAAYRYNGVKLPALPAWDADAFPYACIQYISYRGGSFISHLRCSDQPFLASSGVITNPENAVILVHTYMESDADYEWGVAYTMEGLTLSLDPGTVIWSNTDITDESGAVVLAAAEPVPVQAVTQPFFRLNSWLFGFTVGLAAHSLGAVSGESADIDA